MCSNRLKLAFTVAGTVIGAGFATGKELMLFFDSTPRALTCLILCILIMCLVSLLYFRQAHKRLQFSTDSFVFQLIFLLFSAVSYTVMLACGGEALWESTGLARPIGTVLTCAVTLGIVYFGVSNVYRFNMIATPILLVCMAGISVVGLLSPASLLEASSSQAVNLLIYSGYNLLSVLPVLGALAGTVDKKEGYHGILWGFCLVAVVGILLKLLLIRYHVLTNQSAIPVLSIISYLGSNLSLIYTVMLYLSILTTAVNSLFAVARNKNPLPASLILLCCSFLGFTPLIETLYPLFGYIGIGVTVTLIIKAFFKESQKG